MWVRIKKNDAVVAETIIEVVTIDNIRNAILQYIPAESVAGKSPETVKGFLDKAIAGSILNPAHYVALEGFIGENIEFKITNTYMRSVEELGIVENSIILSNYPPQYAALTLHKNIENLSTNKVLIYTAGPRVYIVNDFPTKLQSASGYITNINVVIPETNIAGVEFYH